MTKLISFSRIKGTDRLLVLHAIGLLVFVHIILRGFPFKWAEQKLLRSKPRLRPRTKVDQRQILRAIRVGSRNSFGHKTCLMRALAARILLARHGFHSELKIGVRRGEEGNIEAHAWLEQDGVILINGMLGHADWRVFPELEKRATPGL